MKNRWESNFFFFFFRILKVKVQYTFVHWKHFFFDSLQNSKLFAPFFYPNPSTKVFQSISEHYENKNFTYHNIFKAVLLKYC